MGLTSTTSDSESLIINTSTDRLLLAATDHLVERDTVYLDDLVADTGNITVRTTHASADTFDHDFVVLVNEVDGTVAGGESGQFVAVLDERDLDGLSDAGVGLFGFDADLFDHDALGLSGPSKRVVLGARLEHALLVSAVRPTEFLSVFGHLGTCEESSAHHVHLIEAIRRLAAPI